MKAKILFIITITFISYASIGIINNDIENLEKKVSEVKGKSRVDILNELAEKIRAQNPKKSIDYGKQALDLAKKLNYRRGEARAIIAIGSGSCSIGLLEKALELFKEAYIIFAETNDKRGMADSLRNQGVAYTRLSEYQLAMKALSESMVLEENLDDELEMSHLLCNFGTVFSLTGDFQKALNYYRQSLGIAEKLDSKNEIIAANNNIGNVYYELGDYEASLSYYIKSLKLREEIGDKRGIASSLNNIGSLYNLLGNFEKSIDFHLQSLNLKREMQDENGVANSLNNIGFNYLQLEEYQKALEYSLKSFHKFDAINDSRGKAFSLNNIGQIYMKKTNYEKAVEYFSRSLEINNKIGNRKGQISTLISLGKINIHLKDFEKSRYYFILGLGIAKDIQSKQFVCDIHQSLYELSKINGRFKEALLYHESVHKIYNEIFSEKSAKKITEMQIKYETEKKERAIDFLKKDNTIQKLKNNQQLVIGAIFIIALFIILFFLNKSRRMVLKRSEEKLRSMQKLAELKLYQARINPHFIGNALLSATDESLKVSKSTRIILKKLGEINKGIQRLSGKDLIPIQEELDLIQSYIELEKEIFNGELSYELYLPEELKELLILPLTIEPFVENAVRHGIYPTNKGGKVTVTIHREQDELDIDVNDNGVGFAVEEMKISEGTFNVLERLKIFYKNRARFTVKSSPGEGTSVRIIIPVK